MFQIAKIVMFVLLSELAGVGILTLIYKLLCSLKKSY